MSEINEQGIINQSALKFIACEKPVEEADICLFGAPFDSTASFRPGSRFAPQAMRQDSWALETYSPYQDDDLENKKVCDCGDLELPLGETEAALAKIKDQAAAVCEAGKIPFMIGGEHLVTYGALEACYEKFGVNLRLIHIDAHTDLRDELFGVKLSHATVIRRCAEMLGDKKVYQFGIRSGEKQEFEWAEEHTTLHKFDLEGLEKTVERLRGYPVYFTLDLDVLDPSVFPGTGTPEPGGVSYAELQRAVIKICGELNIVGCDIVELAPGLDQSGASTAAACKILREMLIAL